MKCLVCRGACCEVFSLPVADVKPPSNDARRWLQMHARMLEDRNGPLMEFECRCTALTQDGCCGIYEDRPQVCRDFRPGSNDCLDYVRRRRTHEDYLRIRDGTDPVAIH